MQDKTFIRTIVWCSQYISWSISQATSQDILLSSDQQYHIELIARMPRCIDLDVLTMCVDHNERVACDVDVMARPVMVLHSCPKTNELWLFSALLTWATDSALWGEMGQLG